MFLGKLRKHIEEIRHKHSKLEVEIRMPSYEYSTSSEYFSVVIFDSETFLHAKRILSTTDLDSYAGDPEDLLIIVIDYLVREIEKKYEEHESALAKIGSADEAMNE